MTKLGVLGERQYLEVYSGSYVEELDEQEWLLDPVIEGDNSQDQFQEPIFIKTREITLYPNPPKSKLSFLEATVFLEDHFVAPEEIYEIFYEGFKKLKEENCFLFLKKHPKIKNHFYRVQSNRIFWHFISEASIKEILEIVDGSKIPIHLQFDSRYRGNEEDVDPDDIPQLQRFRDSTALFKAMLCSDLNQAEFLLEHGANPYEIFNLSPEQKEVFRRLRFQEPSKKLEWCRLMYGYQRNLLERVKINLNKLGNRHLLKQDPVYGNSWKMIPSQDRSVLSRNLSEIEISFLEDDFEKFALICNKILEGSGASYFNQYLLNMLSANPEYLEQIKLWLERVFSVPNRLHRTTGIEREVLIPDTCFKGDLPKIEWLKLLNQSQLLYGVFKDLDLLHQRLTERRPYTGTPNPDQDPEGFKRFFDNLNRSLKHIYEALSTRPVQEREAVFLGLAECAHDCGTRHFAELRNYLSILKPEIGDQGLSEELDLKSHLECALRKIRKGVMLRMLSHTSDPHMHNAYYREVGEFLGVHEPGLSYEDPTIRRMTDFEKNCLIRDFFKIYTTDYILKELEYSIYSKQVPIGFISQKIGELGGDLSWFDVEGFPTRQALFQILKSYRFLEISENAKSLF